MNREKAGLILILSLGASGRERLFLGCSYLREWMLELWVWKEDSGGAACIFFQEPRRGPPEDNVREVLLGRRPTGDSQQDSSQPRLGLGSGHPLGSFLSMFLPSQSRSCLLYPRACMARHHAELPMEAAGWHLGVILPELSGQRLTQF